VLDTMPAKGAGGGMDVAAEFGLAELSQADVSKLAKFHALKEKASIYHVSFKRGAKSSLGGSKSSLGDAESSLGDANSSLDESNSSLGDAESSLGDVKTSLGDAESLLGDATSSLGDANISLSEELAGVVFRRTTRCTTA
jgi:hypothetical protein